ncbi:hypothetical protein [Chitinophaga pinensis]|nr:hypothetical protein [Chitinophaga pinensis]
MNDDQLFAANGYDIAVKKQPAAMDAATRAAMIAELERMDTMPPDSSLPV